MGRGVVNIKYKRIFKLFFFVVIFFVLIGICSTFKTYAAVKVQNVFPKATTERLGFYDDETGESGFIPIIAAWKNKPPTTETKANTTIRKYRSLTNRQPIIISKSTKTIGNLKVEVPQQTITPCKASEAPLGNGTNNKIAYIAVIQINLTTPAGYIYPGKCDNVVPSKTADGSTNFTGYSFSYRAAPKGAKQELAYDHPFVKTQAKEHTKIGYLYCNVAYLGLETSGESEKYASATKMLQNARYKRSATYHFAKKSYDVEYSSGEGTPNETYTDAKIPGESSALRGATYSKKHYHQTGWSGYSQYQIIKSDRELESIEKHYEDYNLGQEVTAPYTQDGWIRGPFSVDGVPFITKTTESKIVLEPKWEADSFTIKYDPNGGKLKPGVTEADCTQKVKYDNGDKLRNYEPYIENPYGRFRGWSTDPTGTKILRAGSSIDNIDVEDNGTITLYAIYYTNLDFRFNAYDRAGEHVGAFADGTDNKIKRYKMGDVLAPLDSSFIPELDGYRFAGFYAGDTMFFNSKGNPVDVELIIKNNQIINSSNSVINLYAKYTPITNASCSEDSATIPNIPVNPPSENGGPATENLHLKILKKDQNTEELLDGAIFTLQGTGDNSDFSVERTTVYGVANFDLSNAKAGEYKLSETKAPDGYKTSGSTCPWTFTLEVNTVTDSEGVKHEIRRIKGIKDKNGEKVNTPTLTDDSYNCTIYNTSKKQTLKITKKDSKTGEPLTGAVFRLTGPNGYNEERRVDISGVVKFEDLEPGDYELKETTVPVGYILSGKIYAVKVTENDVTITEK